jgi:hypothetical protein
MASRNNKTIVDEVTTLRRHLEANHSVRAPFTHYSSMFNLRLLGEVSELGKGCQLRLKITRRR